MSQTDSKKSNILIAYPIDHASIFLGMQAFFNQYCNISYCILLGHKLLSDVDNQVTLYIDPDIKNDFMKHAKDDLVALVKDGQNEVKTTSSEVRNVPDHLLQIAMPVCVTFMEYADQPVRLELFHSYMIFLLGVVK